METPTKYDDIIDSRDIIAAAPETAAERDRLREALELANLHLDAAWDRAHTADIMVRVKLARDGIKAALATTTPPAPNPLRDAAPDMLAFARDVAGYPHADHGGMTLGRARTVARRIIAKAGG